jgi:hypothetical protein
MGFDSLDRDPQARSDVFVRKAACLAQKVDLPVRLAESGDSVRVHSECLCDPIILLAKPILYNLRLDRILHILLDLSGFTTQP